MLFLFLLVIYSIAIIMFSKKGFQKVKVLQEECSTSVRVLLSLLMAANFHWIFLLGMIFPSLLLIFLFLMHGTAIFLYTRGLNYSGARTKKQLKQLGAGVLCLVCFPAFVALTLMEENPKHHLESHND